MRLPAACAPEELRIDQPQQRAFQGIDRDHRMQRDAAALRLRADRRRVLHSKHMATTDPAARAPRRRRYNLRHAHRRIAQKARDPHLAGAVPAKPAHAHTATAALHQPLKLKDPPFSKRRPPNPPNTTSLLSRPPHTITNPQTENLIVGIYIDRLVRRTV